MIAVQNYADRAQWLEARRGGIGSSDAAAILGQSKWASPYSLWAEKVHGLRDESEIPEYIRWGNVLEAPIRDEYQRRTGRTVNYAGPFAICRSADLPFLSASLDGEIPSIADFDGPGNYEGKTAGAHKSGDWEVEPPLAYQIQTQHQMLVTGRQWASIACLIGGQKLVWFDIERNQRFIDAMMTKLAAFWRCVETGTPPEVDGGESTTNAIKLLHPADNGQSIELPEAAGAKWLERQLLSDKINDLEDRRNEIDNWFRAQIGDCTYGTCRGATWSLKSTTRKSYTVKEATFRQLRKAGKS